MALPITTSPDITLLDFDILYDISGATPTITLTNASVGNPSGTTNLSNCSWWYKITTPSATIIHEGNSATPDVPNANWTTITVPDTWPTPFGVPPYGQIEFSCSVPYTAVLYVKDSDDNIFSLTKTGKICRPNGNTPTSKGNFGEGKVNMQTMCNKSKITAADITNYTYQGLLGTGTEQKWTLTYPQNVDGVTPAPVEVEDMPYVVFSIGFNGEGYQIYMNTYSTYEVADGVFVKIQYKFKQLFNVYCNIDLCPLVCEIDAMYKQLSPKCGTSSSDIELKDKLLRINSLLNLCFIGISQPLCGVNVPALIEKIKKIGDFECNCCSVPGGINGISEGASLSFNFTTCGDITASVSSIGDNYTFDIKDTRYLFQICEDSDSEAFSFESSTDTGSCTKTICLKTDLEILRTELGLSAVFVQFRLHGTTDNACNGSGVYTTSDGYLFPCNLYDPTDTTLLLQVNTLDELLTALNIQASWTAFGMYSNAGKCGVLLSPTTSVDLPDYIYLDPVAIEWEEIEVALDPGGYNITGSIFYRKDVTADLLYLKFFLNVGNAAALPKPDTSGGSGMSPILVASMPVDYSPVSPLSFNTFVLNAASGNWFTIEEDTTAGNLGIDYIRNVNGTMFGSDIYIFPPAWAPTSAGTYFLQNTITFPMR